MRGAMVAPSCAGVCILRSGRAGNSCCDTTARFHLNWPRDGSGARCGNVHQHGRHLIGPWGRRLAMVGGRNIAFRNGGTALRVVVESRHTALACRSAVGERTK
ncbi:hypothetical protein XFF6992_40018 [Xanthomonas citri pv. fuscans]|nr:hypothetical protein XFF6992_40018 [Xanthomonas citri pv. fuscans]SOO31925.1 hypothetical protein XFF6994_160018 [Xanthomonas citri pv. fuscans]